MHCVDNNGNSCLHLALLNKHENCALYILDKIEANSHLINLQNKEGDTLLHIAASVGYLTCVEILLSKGADIWAKNYAHKRTPLVMCAKNDKVADCLEIMLSRMILLISNGTMTSATTSNKTTSNLMMMMMTPSQNPPLLLVNNQKSDPLEASFVSLNNMANSTAGDINSTTVCKNTPTRLGPDFKIADCIRIHNETSNLNSTLILTENEAIEGDEETESATGGGVEAAEQKTLEVNAADSVSESLDACLLEKIAPIPETGGDPVKSTTIVTSYSVEKLNENVNPSEFSSNSSSYDSDYY